MNVLVVKGNNRPAEEAISSKMYETFLAAELIMKMQQWTK